MSFRLRRYIQSYDLFENHLMVSSGDFFLINSLPPTQRLASPKNPSIPQLAWKKSLDRGVLILSRSYKVALPWKSASMSSCRDPFFFSISINPWFKLILSLLRFWKYSICCELGLSHISRSHLGYVPPTSQTNSFFVSFREKDTHSLAKRSPI